jgi:DNA-directed RNA polymerase specialized sigma subunit
MDEQDAFTSRRDDRLLNHLPMVVGVAGRAAAKAGGRLDLQDLVDVGVLALLDAMDRFPDQDERRFAVSARMRVTSALLAELDRAAGPGASPAEG